MLVRACVDTGRQSAVLGNDCGARLGAAAAGWGSSVSRGWLSMGVGERWDGHTSCGVRGSCLAAARNAEAR